MAKRSKKQPRRPKMRPKRLKLQHVGPIVEADVTFGDLTVFVGPQATGKSVFLQTLALVVDSRSIHRELTRVNIDWRGDPAKFFPLYYGEGMQGVWTEQSRLEIDGDAGDLTAFAKLAKGVSRAGERLFYVPAQRVMSLREGLTRPFMDFRSGEPYVLREFGERLHWLVQNEFGQQPVLFPKTNRLKAELRAQISEAIFGGLPLVLDTEDPQKRIVLDLGPAARLPVPVWSAGQREFTPLLLGLYWLMPPGRVARRDAIEWVVIEEPEMGLHTDAIVVVMSLILELLHRGYRVALSTHSDALLEFVWALAQVRQNGGSEKDALELFRLPSTHATRQLAGTALGLDARTYYFKRGVPAKDISSLDPGSEDKDVSEWGGLSTTSSEMGDVVSRVVNRAELEKR